jgi:hypothetical protein
MQHVTERCRLTVITHEEFLTLANRDWQILQ